MCDVCSGFLNLLGSYESRLANNETEHPVFLAKREIETVIGYIQCWPARQCMCCYRDPKNFERFNLVVQAIVYFTVYQLKNIKSLLDREEQRIAAVAAQQPASSSSSSSTSSSSSASSSSSNNGKDDEKESEEDAKRKEEDVARNSEAVEKPEQEEEPKERKLQPDSVPTLDDCWTLLDVEKLLLLSSKAFLLNFPLYVAYKHGVHARMDEISPQEAQTLSIFCDLHDNEIPAFLLRNVSLFCTSGGFDAMMACFEHANLPVPIAHAITAAISNLKLWINYRSIIQLFIPIRVKILQYMCKLSDQDLRSPATKSMADFMWTAIKDPLDSQITFDTEGLALAFKYFTSSTLTMRLAGMAQINAHINLFNEICTTETVAEVEVVGQKLADWLTENQIISHLFGPNLHVEVIKQSHIVLNFLAVENQITEEHITLIWQAAQLKHCSKPIYDILPSLVKNLAPRPASHLYSLLSRLDPKEHTEQSIYIASALTKLIWARDCSRLTLMDLAKNNVLREAAANSVSVDGSNSEDEPQEEDTAAVVSGGKNSVAASDSGVAAPPPCKQARHKNCCDETTDGGFWDWRIPLMSRSLAAASGFTEDAGTSSEEDCLGMSEAFSAMRKKMLRKKRKKISGLTRKELQEMAESVSDVEDSDLLAAMLPDSDCSDTNLQSSVLRHMGGHHGPIGPVGPEPGEDVPPFMGAMSEGHLINFLNAAENDGSCSSPLSNKSEKNMGDFDDEDSPCEEELVELAARAQCLHQQFPLPRPRSLGPGMVHGSPQARTNTPNITLTRAHHDRLSSSGGSIGPMTHPMTPSVSSSGTPTSTGGKGGKMNPATPTTMGGKTPQAPSKEMQAASASGSTGGSSSSLGAPSSPNIRFPDVCQPGNTLLWDLLQDDKIGQLGESLALEAEKVLGTLLCFHTDKIIRTRFIEGCLQNLAENRSVVTSLRLLPKLFASFQQFRDVTTHQVVLWAERHHRMMHHFFNNLKHYTTGAGRSGRQSETSTIVLNQNGFPLYSHVTQIQVRLQFLSSVFSDVGSPRNFKLTLSQVDTLWACLANDPECSDCLFAWLQGQVKGGDTHALGINAIQHLYLKRLSELKPEGISMVALGLFQQLFTLGREEIISHPSESQESSDSVGMEHLWKIALRAHNTDVSLTAIQYINTYYMEKQLKYENQFVAQCMTHLTQAVEELDRQGPGSENALMCVQRALMLLNTHLETFRRRYAYHLRRWALEGKEVGMHSALRNEGPGPPIRIVLQPAGVPEKSVLHLHATDLVADLKAEIAKWWETIQGSVKTAHNETVLGLLLSEGPLRIITQGQEITAEYDERSLADVGFKDNQMVYVSMGSRGGRRRDHHDHPSMQPPPPKDCLPTLLLLKSPYFEQLFKLMQTLGDMKLIGPGGRIQPNTKAQLLSRRVWDILAMLPTAPTFLSTLKNLSFKDPDSEPSIDMDSPDNPTYTLQEILEPRNLQKFMYSLHIVESLCKSKFMGSCCGGSPAGAPSQLKLKISSSKSLKLQNQKLAKQQAQVLGVSNSNVGGMVSPSKLSVSPSGGERKMDVCDGGEGKTGEVENKENNGAEGASSPEKKDEEKEGIPQLSPPMAHPTPPPPKLPTSPASASLEWSEQFIKCGGLAHLYQIFISGVLQKQSVAKDGDDLNEWRHDCLASLLRILCLLGMEEFKPENENAIIIPKLNRHTLALMEVRPTLERIAGILNEESHPLSPHHFKTGLFGRAQVIHYAMNLLVCYAHSLAEVRSTLWKVDANLAWVQRLILDDPEPAVRREACAALYRMCLGNAQTYYELMAPLLSKLVALLPLAEKMRPQSQAYHLSPDEGKEPYGPACRDYFWLLCRLVDSLSPELVKDCGSIGIESMCRQVSKSILDRDYLESRHGSPDDGLFGLLNLMANLVKFDPQFKFSDDGQDFIGKIFQSLFELPSPDDREKPKCKSHGARAAAYDLLVEMCKSAPKNYLLLHGKLMQQHRAGPHSPYPWDYWPRDEGRSECGYVGLTNLGATCYMASCIQHLFMTPQTRDAILSISPDAPQKHKATLYELQRMFAYLMESERKAYCPRSFCRVYQMDHQPLNTGEQKDMAEFFIDLVSKLEEMTPELKTLVKRVFCGVISNNVVSLDCGHVSRTLEEFYTVRCQVADMRNLHESLDEVTVKDTLEGDNMYTCSQCGKKVRAEKRACFKKLPQILCFNTMRYTFNMVTMLKEKVNTHFSFPMRLDMSGYVEKTLMPQHYQEEKRKSELRRSASRNAAEKAEIQKQQQTLDEEDSEDFNEHYEYDLVGVTVHTGNADGGHYYSFIKERNEDSNPNHQERWFLFNDAEVKLFDPSQIAAECFGGEMTSKTYDSVTEKYLDFSFEKTNSAYMLFYEWRSNKGSNIQRDQVSKPSTCTSGASMTSISEQPVTSSSSSAFASSGPCTTASIGASISENDSPSELPLPSPPSIAAVLPPVNIRDAADQTERIILKHPGEAPSVVDNLNTLSKCDIDVKPSLRSTVGVVPSLASVPGQPTISSALQPCTSSAAAPSGLSLVGLGKELEEWIWQDNRHFLQDRNIFEHTYFNFMWQICGHIPQTLLALPDITCIAAQLSVSFFIETFIHAKEKPTMVLWVELLTKQFNASQEACEWFLSHMSAEPWWPVQVLIQCPNQMVRQMFQRLVIHVIQRLRQSHSALYLKVESDEDGNEIIGNVSCVTRFIKSLIMLMEHGARAHLRHLSEFFGLLYEFSRMGEEEALFLLRINVIRSVADFYLGHKAQDCIDTNSDNEDNSSDEALTVDKSRPASLDKMIALVASLVERSRGPDLRLHLSARDYNAIAGGKGFPFLYQQIKDNINPHQTRHLIHALCRCDERLAGQIIAMLFTAVTKHTELCGPFFKLLTLLTESTGGPSGLPCFSQLVLQRVWDAAEYCPQSALDWLAVQAPRNKIAHTWILQSAESWVETFLLAHNNARVRNAAAYLLVSLVPSQNFRTNFRATSHHKLTMHASQPREISCEAQLILHTILNLLLRLLRSARNYTDISVHGTTKLTAYFNLMTYCLVSKTEKLMLGPHLRALWELFHPRLSEPSVPAHHNKQALLAFWYQATLDCPENALLVANCPDITRNIAFNYILADHDDSEIVTYNRAMLPVYYGLLRMCCQQSRLLTRQLAAHQNLQWAFKNITPHPTQYPLAVDELFRLMTLFAQRHPDATEAEQREVTIFRRTTLTAYLSGLDARVSWGTLIAALRILVDNDDDRLFVVLNGGITLCFDALHTLHSMYHEATACHVFGDLQELLTEVILLISTLRASCREQKKRPPPALMKGLPDAVRRLATLLNTFNPPEMRNLALEVLKELVKCAPPEIISTVLVPLLTHCHTQNVAHTMGPLGSYFPRRGMKAQWPPVSKNTPRPPRPMVQMNIPQSQICEKGLDKDFDLALELFYRPYHEFLDIMFRVAVTSSQFNEPLVHLSLLTGIEAVVLHFNIFAKFWVGIYNNKTTNRYAELLIKNPLLVDYIDEILRDERLSLNDPVIANFIEIYYPKVKSRLVVPRLLESICQLLPDKGNLEDICGDLQAIRIIGQRTGIPGSVKTLLQNSLHAV
ncbi:AAEL011975-PA, partial [Aedes aegypti]